MRCTHLTSVFRRLSCRRAAPSTSKRLLIAMRALIIHKIALEMLFLSNLLSLIENAVSLLLWLLALSSRKMFISASFLKTFLIVYFKGYRFFPVQNPTKTPLKNEEKTHPGAPLRVNKILKIQCHPPPKLANFHSIFNGVRRVFQRSQKSLHQKGVEMQNDVMKSF